MGWENQGRQEHGWFGHGTGPVKPGDGAPDALSTNASPADLATALAYGAIASLPATQRARAEAAFQGRNLSAFRDAMLAWMRGTGMKRAIFADRFFGRSADDPVVQALGDAATLAKASTTAADMAAASGKVAEAMQRVGLDRWSRFLADSQIRASDPATEAAIRADIRAPDAITRVYPLEYLSGVRGAAGLLRAGVGAVLRQVLPEGPPVEGRSQASSAEKPGTGSQSSGNEPNPEPQPRPSALALPANPDDLLAQGWREITHPNAAREGHRTFENSGTGEVCVLIKGSPGSPGSKGKTTIIATIQTGRENRTNI